MEREGGQATILFFPVNIELDEKANLWLTFVLKIHSALLREFV
jgi:hypothetical protein